MSSGPSISSNPFNTTLTEAEIRKKRSRARWRLALIFLALVGLTGLEVYLLQERSSISDNIPVLLLFNIILILLFLLIVLIVRNFVKLHNERKSRILGSRFQTKLIVAFLTLALVPSILLFFVASKLFSYSVGNWFSFQVEDSLQQSMEVAREYYSYVEKQSHFHAQQLEKQITGNQLYRQEKRVDLDQLVANKVVDYNLGALFIYDNAGQLVAARTHPDSKLNSEPEDFLSLIRASTGDERISEVRSYRGENYLSVLVPLTQKVEDGSTVWGYIVTLSEIPKSSLMKIGNIQNMFEQYKKQSLLKLPVSANYYFTFLLITLLILFSAIWLGIYLARGITIPIQQLAEGTRRVASGDLNVRIRLDTTDEIGILVTSFNQMTGELQENRKRIEQANEDLKSTNFELERRRNYIETVLENVGAGVISIDKKGLVTTFNNAAKRILGYSKNNPMGSTYKDAFPPSFHDPIRQMIRKMSRENSRLMQEQVEITLGDAPLNLLVNLNFMLDHSKKYLGLLIVFEDLTQLIKAQKVAAWQEVAQGIAHEIKNPLTPIQLNTQRLKKKYYEDKVTFSKVFDESIDIITQEVEGMKQLLNEFLRFSRMPTPSPRATPIHPLIKDVIRLYEGHEKNIRITTRFDPNLQNLFLDPDQIRRVFINLFDNALDALSAEGNIIINTWLHSDTGRVRIEFSDDGKGIQPQNREKLFLPHFTTKKRGTGLGLAIVSRIIIDHNGLIQVRDNHPRGTTFIIELPVSSSQDIPERVA
ncbi:MAG: HAMP domain-containing protein [Candidatus Nitronauta litoralis]|uniref:histidine kinase n=1 Tax=Candidatus Nitronauta litoralis TaxID=2705533 RepID=A0A7T0G0X1_9BACT|nr:MAG: HAMP domain-containing protein [Candidatus Nitronauta litoralis]